MTTGPLSENGNWLCPEATQGLIAQFEGDLGDVTDARLAAGLCLDSLAHHDPPASPESRGDILLVITELAAAAVRRAPGPFTVRLRRTLDGVHVAVEGTRPALPRPTRHVDGLGRQIVRSLSRHVSVSRDPRRQEIHALLPW
ncbi:ATP-binding protein [Streptomyces purpureus]|uniref:ATP-binding protein n=1 Tax=Streptomyces purpureus TaxID=1951 RepID=A0A918GWL8_9ACTN|nr:ATP-binding protein [Streptomyces purpureus]GGT15527.1 ATP-binding protein [Streptomyces purpureus]